jgi:ferrous iron transport protein A
MEMGITRGTEILVHKAAPLGDPVEVKVRGYALSMRKADIDSIEISDAEQTHDGGTPA